MRVLQALVASLLPMTALAAKQTGLEKFQDYHSKQVSKGGPLKLTDSTYSRLTGPPRNYSTAVLLTALDPRFGCGMCHEFQPEWDLLVKSWTKGDKAGASRVVFGTLDFMDGKGTFQSLMLQTAPILLLFPPSEGPYAKPDGQPKRLDFNTGSPSGDSVHHWISRALPHGPHPKFVRPINYVKIVITLVAVLGSLTLFTVAAPYVVPILQNRNLWAALSLIAILLFTSGHMFNHIRKVPYVVGDGKGKVSYFAGGFQNQVGLETQIIAALYGVLAFATISLALKVPRMADPRMQQIAVFVWGGVIFGTYSFLMSVFRIKNSGYPFWLPPF
ncbi:Dolichyl-diphosphooligosaccharide--protein glycosyltransferase subunit 3 [Sphaceloma murrayae]|uniref:Dolichyl-diphosphooligosaccharide--protein glycosyltransferase subunit 3 n=1 Tax=Sphaceloma murrayae TaxID=2082308 RepID=A0A2K1R057_9PEZI|nr:Dolichyl-diphosphooligosaccharide--protein glycosyltransferase subunit 3 [Sphaceloma murrayae]